jgi:SPP1 family phage portal protein
LVKIASVKGSAYEVLFTSENDEGDVIPRFGVVEPENMLVAYDTTLTPEPSFAMRVYETVDIVEDETTVHIDFYTESKMYHYLLGGKGEIRLEGVEEHYFGSVPVVEYINNDERIGDFERVLTLIDAYDKAQSDTANDHEYFSDAYLKIVNFSGTNAQDINAMKKDRVIMVDADGDIEWVTKQINDTAIENYKDRLQQDLHTVSKVPRLTDESFAGSASGVALEFKMWGLEQNAAQKERKFKKGLQRRLELICNFLKVKGQDYDYRDYKLVFTRNMPTNLVEIVDTVVKLKGIISDQTAIAQLPFIEDVNDELEMIEREQEGRVNLDIEQDIENTEDLEDDSDERESGIDT